MRRKEQKSFYRKRKKGRRIEKDHKHYSRRLRQGKNTPPRQGKNTCAMYDL